MTAASGRVAGGCVLSVHESTSQEWRVEVAKVCRWPGEDGWSEVPASSQPTHHLDFHIGLACHGMRTAVYRHQPPPSS